MQLKAFRVKVQEQKPSLLFCHGRMLHLPERLMFWGYSSCFFNYLLFKKIIYAFFFFFAVLGLCYRAWAFSSWGEQGLLSLQCAGFLLWWLLLLRSTGSRHVGLRSCSRWAQYLWLMGLGALRPVGSSWTRDGTHVSCTTSRLNLWAPKEALTAFFRPKEICLPQSFFFYKKYTFILFSGWLCSMQNLSSPTRDRTHALCNGSMSLNHWPPQKILWGYPYKLVSG